MKLTRYNGHVPLFSQDMEGRERTLFGSTVQDDDINNQFTPEFLRGWGSVGSTEFPTLQDFNALAYTHNKLLSYLYQAGIPSYSQNEEYYIGSIVQYNKDIYICLRDKPTVLPTDTNAWKRVQESLTFVGDGPEVMKKGAFGIGSINSPQIDNNVLLKNISNSIWRVGILYPDVPSWGTTGSTIFRIGWGQTYFNVLYLSPIARRYAIKSVENANDRGWDELYTTANTRTDKNKVLHAGTSTPINTLNVSDMSQEVINNDLLTVTSGAVYRALQLKADLTYVNTELSKKANLTYVNTELDKKITGGNIVQTTGQSTVDVISQKGVTDIAFGINQKWVDVTRDRIVGSTYTNATTKPIEVFITFDPNGNQDHFFIDEISMMSIYDVNAEAISLTVPPGSTYRLAGDGGLIDIKWMELR